MKTLLSLLLFASLGVAPARAATEREQLIESGRISLGDIVTNLAPNAAAMDLGVAPRAGSSRLLSADEINRALKTAGEKRTVTDGVRVLRSTKRWSQPELVAWISPVVTEALPSFVTLIRIEAPRSLLTAATTTIGHVELPQLPKRTGTVRSSAVVNLTVNGQLEQRLSLPIVLELKERPKPVTIPRGQQLVVSINLGLTRVSATAITLQTVELGAITLCRILKTKKVLRARIVSPNTAEVVSE